MRLTREEVEHIATLCRLGMTEDDVEMMRDQLSHILEMFQVLQELDTEDVPPTGHSISLETVMRADAACASLPKDDVLANAPKREGDLFQVKRILEE